MLIQRTIGHSLSSKSNMHGWTLLVPAGWSMPFFSSLVFTGSRVAGLRERRVQQFECGSGMAFPEDYVTTQAHNHHSSEIRAKDRARWERTPPAKRANFDAVEPANCRTPDVWEPEWRSLNPSFIASHSGDPVAVVPDKDMIPTQPPLDAEDAVPANSADSDGESTVPTNTLEPWLLSGPDASVIVDELSSLDPNDTSESLLSRITQLRQKRGMNSDTPIHANALLDSALITVSLSLLHRGSPRDFAVIYAPRKAAIPTLAALSRLKEGETSVRIKFYQFGS